MSTVVVASVTRPRRLLARCVRVGRGIAWIVLLAALGRPLRAGWLRAGADPFAGRGLVYGIVLVGLTIPLQIALIPLFCGRWASSTRRSP